MELLLLSILQSQLIEVKIDLYKFILSIIIGYLENCGVSLLFLGFLWIFPLVSILSSLFSLCLPPLSCTFLILGISGFIYSLEIILCCPLLLVSNALIEFILPLMTALCFPLAPCDFLCVTLFDLGIGLVGPPFQILSICDSIPSFCSAICPPLFIFAQIPIIFCPFFSLFENPSCLELFCSSFPSHLYAISMGVRAATTDLPFRVVRPIALACRACPCCYPIGGMASTLGDLTMTFWNTCSLTLFQSGILLRDLLLEGRVSEVCKAKGLVDTLKELFFQGRELFFWELKIPAYFFKLASNLPYTVGLLNALCFLPRCFMGGLYYCGWLICPICPIIGYPLVCLGACGEEIFFAGSSLLMGLGDNFGHLCAGLNRICMCSGWSCFFGAPLPWQVDWGWWKGLCKIEEIKCF